MTITLVLGCKNQSSVNHTSTKKSRVVLPKDIKFDTIINSQIQLTNGKTIESNLNDLRYLGIVHSNNRIPFIVVSGKYCTGCDANKSIYIESLDAFKFNTHRGENRYPYPGILRDNESSELLQTSRAFYGMVLHQINGVIWFFNNQSEPNQTLILLTKIENGHKVDTSYISTKNEIEVTLSLLKQKKCFEIKGEELYTEP
jgi:hypothetical protein